MRRRTNARPFSAGLLALVASSVLGCAADEPSFHALKSSADARLHATGAPERADETSEKLLGDPLTPDSAVRVALLNNRGLRAAYEKLGVAHGEMVHALRLPNPRADAALRFRPSGPAELEILATIGLTELALLSLRDDAASADIEAARLEVVASIVDLAFDVRAAFVAYQAAEQTLELLRSVLAATQASADAAARMHEAGNLTDLDLANERAFNEEARVMLRRADAARTTARARLNTLMGLRVNTEWSAGPRLPEPPSEELALGQLEQQALDHNLDLAITKHRRVSAEKHATLARSQGLVPDLRAGVSAKREGEWGVGPAVSLEVPLFYQGQGLVSAAHAEGRRQTELAAALATEVRNAAHAAAANLMAARESALEYRDVLLPLKQRVLDQTELEYNAMAVGVFQLLQAKRDEVETARTYVELLRDYWAARDEVERLRAGRLKQP